MIIECILRMMNNPGDVRSFDERLKQKLTPEEYELVTSWR